MKKSTNLPQSIEWRDSQRVEHCKCLFVNNERTNIYYFTPENKYFGNAGCDTKAIQDAKNAEQLIREGNIYPTEGYKWEGFDTCGMVRIILADFDCIELTEEGNFENAIHHLTGWHNPTFAEVIEWHPKSYLTQWTKAIDKRTGEMMRRIGFKIGAYGFSMYFIH